MPPLAAALSSAAIPLATGRLLAWSFLRGLPESGEPRRRALAPYRRAAFLVGIAQLQLAWMAGVSALGPELVGAPGGPAALAFGAVCALIAFAAGGVARTAEAPTGAGVTTAGALALRVRLSTLALGPLAVGAAAAALPVRDAAGAVAWGWVAAAGALCVGGVAFGGLALATATGAVRPAGDRVRRLAREAAAREGARLGAVLRLPTAGARLVNAAALPWARAVVVTDDAAELLDDDELGAVLAHEAGHLSEPPLVLLARLAVPSALLFGALVGPRLLGDGSDPLLAGGAFVATAIAALVATRRLSRRMEERADRRASEAVGGAALARALRRIHAHAQIPTVRGGRRTHPDLHDRLVSLGEDPGPRPPPPPDGGRLFGLAIASCLVGLPLALHTVTDVPPESVTTLRPDRARWRLRLDPWDAEAMLALSWASRREQRLSRAEERAALAARMGPDPIAYHELWTELHAARRDCAGARAAFDRALRERAARSLRQEAPLELGGYHLPPTFIRECEIRAPSLDEPAEASP